MPMLMPPLVMMQRENMQRALYYTYPTRVIMLIWTKYVSRRTVTNLAEAVLHYPLAAFDTELELIPVAYILQI
ncbi:hypothetical protein KQX54_017313 [Cotesia glomerata]|uniref:Uncharacterized protein n=1 Tax=Cotesia glomerata TaxID=32391 RepID=A0AAV7IEA7_COTGL|nr:hypothetical protein KQX54_017313 [Cotesia glomerata]